MSDGTPDRRPDGAPSEAHGALAQLDTAPLVERVRDAILDEILDGGFADDRLPPEAELGRLLEVSRPTVRAALRSLEHDGVVVRRRAIGTTINRHVRPSALALQRLVGFDRLLRAQGYETEVETSCDRAPPPRDMAVAFDLPPGQEHLVTERLYRAGGAPAVHVRDAVPWEHIAHEATWAPGPSLRELTRSHCHEPIDHAVVLVVPMVRTSDVTTRVGVEPGQAFLRLQEYHYACSGHVLAHSMIDADSRFLRLETFRRF